MATPSLTQAAASSGTVNVGETERTISMAAGGLLLLYGLSRLPLSTVLAALAGGALLYRGVTGHCSVYEAIDESTCCGTGSRQALQPEARRSVTDAGVAATGESPARPAV